MPVDNNSFQKNANVSLITNIIWRKKSISRAEIARELNMYRSTVTNITSYLLENGIIKEGSLGASTKLGGRRAVSLSVNPSFGCVLGFDIQPSHYRAVILLADGTELWSEKGSFGSVEFEDMFILALEKALEKQRKIRIPVLAACFSVPGIVTSDFSCIIHSYPFHKDMLDVKEILKGKYNFPIIVENDANSAAWLDINTKSISGNALCIVSDFHEEARTNPDIVGIGTGMGVIINGSVYRGSNNAAGEFKTISWKKGLFDQSGLGNEVLRRTMEDKECLALWMEETFKSLVPILSTMDFDTVILHGLPYSDSVFVNDVIMNRVPEFAEIVKNTNCKLICDTSDEIISAKGTALMGLQRIFSIPDLNVDLSNSIPWDKRLASLKMQGMK